MSERNWNALPDDPDWCGHPLVSLRTWTCAGCGRSVTEATKARLLAADSKAPAGSVWVLKEGYQDELNLDGRPYYWASGVYSDRSRIPHLLLRNWRLSTGYLRDVLRRTHWYQGAFNKDLFEGWAEEENEDGRCEVFSVHLMEIDGE